MAQCGVQLTKNDGDKRGCCSTCSCRESTHCPLVRCHLVLMELRSLSINGI